MNPLSVSAASIANWMATFVVVKFFLVCLVAVLPVGAASAGLAALL